MKPTSDHGYARALAGFSSTAIIGPSFIMLMNERSLPLQVLFGSWLIYGLIQLSAALLYAKIEFHPATWIMAAFIAGSEAIVVFGWLEPPTRSLDFKISVTIVIALTSWLMLANAIGLLRLRETSNTMISGKD